MKSKFRTLISFCCVLLAGACLLTSCVKKRTGDPVILVFSKTSGYHHDAIATGVDALLKLGRENGFLVDTTTNAAYFQEDSLGRYAAVVFLNTTGDVLDQYQEADFERYIQAGGGYVGIHAAADTEHNWEWYGSLVGAYFENHPKVQEAAMHNRDKQHPATAHLPEVWRKTDEWYNYKNLNREVQVLLTLDETSYEGGKNGEHHPIAWYHNFDGGRAFYTGLGHTEAAYQDKDFLQHLLGGIRYAMGENEEPDYDKATSARVPAEERFVKTVLAQGVFMEPTEMTILPDLSVLVVQRRGEIKFYDQQTEEIREVGTLNVYHKATVQGVNAEEGLMGIAADPDFARNHYIYMYYSPADTAVNRLSRFVFKDKKLDLASEKVVLQFSAQRNICCHTGGSIAFGPDKLLYLSTGDNSTPFNERGQAYRSNGYAPLDDRPGHEQYDARRTAANTNDLRGKILRIRVLPDGSYEIPEGNLFGRNESKTRPEIYVMGNRNPYRIAVDQKNGYLYWGEVGPDARADSLDNRGPRGYDEFNQARQAGFYGWPLFVGNNYAYQRYNYGTGKSGGAYDPAKPQNDSRNNTGLAALPPAQSPLIWYPYDVSAEFPVLGSGGRTAMAGPVYYNDLYPQKTAYPDYYNGKVFIYEWVRNWIKVLTLKENGDLHKIENFMGSTPFSAIMDMEVGPDGKIYLLEYGKGWFTANPEAGLSRIDYISGNLPPRIQAFTVDKTSGQLPLTIRATVTATDFEKKPLRYLWKVGQFRKETTEPVLEHTLQQAGVHRISVEVVDAANARTKSEELVLTAGNTQPAVTIHLPANKSFYFTGRPVRYEVGVTDEDAAIIPENLFVSVDYIRGTDLAAASMGHQEVSQAIIGRNLMNASDCNGCHRTEEKSIGPAFGEIARKYQKQGDAGTYLAGKIVKGSSGVWGANPMPAHPAMDQSDARQIAQYILSLADKDSKKASLPAKGEIVPAKEVAQGQPSVLKLTATYTDNGVSAAPQPLTGAKTVYLLNSSIDAGEIKNQNALARKDSLGNRYLVLPEREGWIQVPQVDLTGISGIELAGFGSGSAGSYQVELRLNEVTGPKVGEGQLNFKSGKAKETATIRIQKAASGSLQDIYILLKPAAAGPMAKRPLLKSIRFLPE
ncbi:ThuA domain-containing protein [Botryobacter ruber]|uniref:ThuA domain-containing protein n=1 Tax=Botryobacter ruber TaxID=2171629 RepID=UPI000E0C84DF|nr:ThuA domain-containing protein [Botryobacter ruber]